MTGNENPNIAAIARKARSQARFSLLELRKRGPKTLNVYRNLPSDKAKALASGDHTLQPDDKLFPFPKRSGRKKTRLNKSVLEARAESDKTGNSLHTSF